MASMDYCETGLFSDRIVIRKMINGIPTRFDSKDLPYNIHRLHNGERVKTFIKEEDLMSRLGEQFMMNPKIIGQAFTILSEMNTHQEFTNGPAE
jgi:hypothetical protein